MEDFLFKASTSIRSRRLRRRQRLKRKRKMEGIRLRSDSDGSTKNAFYQGTIVSDSHQENGEYNRHITTSSSSLTDSRRKNTPLNRSTRSNLSTVDGEYNRMPPLPRRSSRSLSSRSKGEYVGAVSPGNAPDAAAAQDAVEVSFELGNSVSDVRDSLRYSTKSLFSTVTNQSLLLGANYVNEDATQSELSPMGSPVHSNEDLEGLLEETSNLQENRDSLQRNSFASIGSGIYFNQPAPPGPLQPRMVYGTMQAKQTGSQFPLQQPNIGQYLGSKNRKSPQPFKNVEPTIEEDDDEDSDASDDFVALSDRIMDWIDLSLWLSKDVSFDEEGVPYFEPSTNWTCAGIIRWLFYNPFYPEFTSLQQFSWAVVLGVFMGIYTAAWKLIIEACVEFTWKTVPTRLLTWGLFTDLDGAFPLYHYMWLVPSLFGAVLSYVITAMETPIPTQNDWIHTLHSRGVEESDTFIPLFLISTCGMASGLSLGPELPLVLTAGMIGSWLGVLCRQSMLQARVMNLTAASAAIGGFFGFPMAGALFVLELPHRMGLQYFEALSPSTIASIIAVLINRIVINNDVTGMFQYPFLNESLPSYIFKDAIVYGLFGGGLGIFYTLGVKHVKTKVHHLLDGCGASSIHKSGVNQHVCQETTPLVELDDLGKDPQFVTDRQQSVCCHLLSGIIPHDPTRAAVTGALAGLAVGVTGMFLPHVMFWGEAQLQTMIDKGRTPLPVFGQSDEPTAALAALGQCMVGQGENSGFSVGCSMAIILAKIFVTGVSLGTGIVGGHFWAPLFVGCTASHLFTDVMNSIAGWLEVPFSLSQYPCVALLCIMGATHVVTFRAHIAIILILTLTIDAFVPEDSALGQLKVAGDYSAVFPLLTVAVFVALQISRKVIFYEKQRSRGDIQALPEALCEPGKEGKPWVMDYEGKMHTLDESEYDYETESDGDSTELLSNDLLPSHCVSREDIEADFQSKHSSIYTRAFMPKNSIMRFIPKNDEQASSPEHSLLADAVPESHSDLKLVTNSPGPEPKTPTNIKTELFQSLDDLLNGPVQPGQVAKDHLSIVPSQRKRRTHRRTQSEPFLMEGSEQQMETMWSTLPSKTALRRPILKRVDSYGEIDQAQPSLMDQVRVRAASVDKRLPR